MKQKPGTSLPHSFKEFVASYANESVRVTLSNGERREGILVAHEDYVTFQDQLGALAMAHIASIVPLTPPPADVPAPKPAKRAR